MLCGTGWHYDEVWHERDARGSGERGSVRAAEAPGCAQAAEAGRAGGSVCAGLAVAEVVAPAVRGEDERGDHRAPVPCGGVPSDSPQDQAHRWVQAHMAGASESAHALPRGRLHSS